MIISKKTYQLYVGAFNEEDNKGIYSYTFNSDTGELINKQLAAITNNSSFLKISPNKKYLYAINETDEFEGTNGAITSFKIEKKQLKKINTMPTAKANACHIGISTDNNFVVASSRGGSNITIFKVNKNGGLSTNPQIIDHQKLNLSKEAKIHASKFIDDTLFSVDLGLDSIKIYNYTNNEFVPAQQTSIDLPNNTGPRHFTFGQKGAIIYVISELNNTITVFSKNSKGYYVEIETKSTLPSGYVGENSCADIHLSKDGKFLYGSNRGENTIVIFKVDEVTGKLTFVDREFVHGNSPRNFALDPRNNFLLVANQKSNNITVFKRNSQKGTLDFVHEVKLPTPVCLEFLDL